MALDFDAVAIGLAQAVTTAAIQVNGKTLTATDFVPDAPTPPHFAVSEFTNDYHQTFDGGPTNGMDKVLVKCRVFTTRGSDAEGQRTARQLVKRSAIPAALEAARGAPGQMALGGAAADLAVVSVAGPRLYEMGAVEFYGFELTILVVG